MQICPHVFCVFRLQFQFDTKGQVHIFAPAAAVRPGIPLWLAAAIPVRPIPPPKTYLLPTLDGVAVRTMLDQSSAQKLLQNHVKQVVRKPDAHHTHMDGTCMWCCSVLSLDYVSREGAELVSVVMGMQRRGLQAAGFVFTVIDNLMHISPSSMAVVQRNQYKLSRPGSMSDEDGDVILTFDTREEALRRAVLLAMLSYRSRR
jgi:hypothetical protein